MDKNANKSIPILHIGYGKTATTWFQKVFYPRVLDIEFYDIKKIRKILGVKWMDINNPGSVYSTIKKTHDRLVICDESMIGSANYLEHNARLINKIFPSAQVIIFIRNQIEKYHSNYCQYIKAGGSLEFQDFIFQNPKKFAEKHLYDKVIDLYISKYGKSNVYVYLYEDFKNNTQEFLKEFCINHNLKLKSNLPVNKKLNTSLPQTAINLKRRTNRIVQRYQFLKRVSCTFKEITHIPKTFHFSTLFFDKLSDFAPLGKKIDIESSIDISNIELLKDYFRNSNQKLIEKHGLEKIRDYNYPL